MIGQLSRHTPVIVQGATGRTGSVHVRRMKEYGTNIVAGVSARAGAESVEGVPVFADCRAAVAATGALVSLAMVPPSGVLAAAQDAIDAGIKLLVTVAEGVPVHDALRIGRMARDAGALWVGASTPGLAIPGEMKLGFLPDVSLRPGPLGMMSKSGTLSYETGYRLGTVGLGTSIWVGRRRRSGEGRALPRSARHVPRRRAHQGDRSGRRSRRQRGRGFRRRPGALAQTQAGLCAGGGPRRQGGRADGPRRCAGVRRNLHVRNRRSAGWRPPARRCSLQSRI